MTRRTQQWPAGIPCWVDLMTQDIEGARGLYSELFGWEIPAGLEEYGGYANATLDGAEVAGMMPAMSPQAPSLWTVYVASDDVHATAAAITAAGGSILGGPHEVPGSGTMVVAADPAGAIFGAWQAGGRIGAQAVNEPGAMTWEHIGAQDVAVSRAFYEQVFGWTFEPMGSEDGTGFTFTDAPGNPPLGSFGSMGPVEAPPSWSVLFSVADADAAVAVVEKHGGTALSPVMETPWGRQAILQDGAGAVFQVMSQPAGTPHPDRAD